MLEFFPFKKTIPFMSWGKATTFISLATFFFAIWALWAKGLNLGVDFTGGTLIEVQTVGTADIERIRASLEKAGLPEISVQNFGTSRDVLSVTQCGPRYQALLRASQVLEYRMEEDRQGEDDRGSVGEKFPYDLSTKPVVTDPRVEQVEVTVSYGHRRQTVSAYRLRIRRQEQAPKANPTLPETPPAQTQPPALPPDSGAFPTGP